MIRIEQCGVSPCAITQIEYDAMNRVTAVTDANNNRSQYTYDLAGRLTQQTGAKGLQQYSYDSRNRLIQWLNARGQKTQYDYYSWGGLQTTSYFPDAASTAATRSVTRTYDNQGNPQNITDSAIQTSILRSQTFDALNRLATETHYHVPGKTLSKTYDYDTLGNIQTLTYNDGSTPLTQSFNHNKRNWLNTATLLSGPYSFNYYNDGREQSRTQTSRTRSHTYYSNGWLQTITDNTNSTAQLTQSFTPDAVGNITNISKLIGVQIETNNFGYDGLNRLTSASNPVISGLNSNESYTYDADGNPNNIGGVTLTHDQDGRLTQYGFNQYRYDPEWRRINRRNAHAHLQATLLGHSLSFGVTGGRLALGQFQAIIAAELDGPRERQVSVQIFSFA